MAEAAASVDEYIATFPAETREALEEVRAAIHAGVPGAEEAISYKIAVVRREGRTILYFAGWKKHIGLYPVPELEPELEAEVKPLRSTKDTVKLMLNEPIPVELISRLAASTAARRESRGD